MLLSTPVFKLAYKVLLKYSFIRINPSFQVFTLTICVVAIYVDGEPIVSLEMPKYNESNFILPAFNSFAKGKVVANNSKKIAMTALLLKVYYWLLI